MKIGYLIPGCGVSGGIAVICQHANRLLDRGHNVYLISNTEEKKIDWFPNQRAPIITLEEYQQELDILIATGWQTSFKIMDLPAKNKFYFVQSDETRFHDKGSVWESLAAISYLFNYNYFTEAKWIQYWLMKNFHHEAALIPNGLDKNIFYPSTPIEPKGDKPRILLEGAIALPYKGMEEAFLAVQDIDAEIWVVSSFGEPKPEWRIDRFFHQVPMVEMRGIYSSCDVLLKLSLVEGFFGPPMEMMACGGTAVVGKVTGYDEYIIDGYNALVVEPGDIFSAKNAVLKILSNDNLKNKLIKNGFNTVNQFQWESSIDLLENYFQSVVYGNLEKEFSPVRETSNRGISFFYGLNKELEEIRHFYNSYKSSLQSEIQNNKLYKIESKDKSNILKKEDKTETENKFNIIKILLITIVDSNF